AYDLLWLLDFIRVLFRSTPWRCFMMAGFAAAYLSTVATQLNWGASYLVNDFYRRFIRKTATERHYVAISRWATVVLFLLSILVRSEDCRVGRGRSTMRWW